FSCPGFSGSPARGVPRKDLGAPALLVQSLEVGMVANSIIVARAITRQENGHARLCFIGERPKHVHLQTLIHPLLRPRVLPSLKQFNRNTSITKAVPHSL